MSCELHNDGHDMLAFWLSVESNISLSDVSYIMIGEAVLKLPVRHINMCVTADLMMC